MAKRYGGKYSPDGSSSTSGSERSGFQGARVTPVGARSNVMFVPAIVLAFSSLKGGATDFALGLGAAAIWVFGAFLLREGLKAQAAYNERKIARPPVPRKIAAAILCGLGTVGAMMTHDAGLIGSLIYGVGAFALHIAAFGIDPLKAKGAEHIDEFQQDRVARVVDEAEAYLTSMLEAARRSGDRQVEGRVERFQISARKLIRTVEDDPRDLTAARKYLGVYLMGARDAAVKFADIYTRSRDTSARSDFMMLLTDLEESFGKKTQALLLDTNSDLTVEIDVLRDRLQREGVRLDRGPNS
ncbi:5-bromo-4-chloroindolyl phosphate hydrolysis protein [Thalassococcus halodurans]|uniref:5-bromo-4-chloroindolyl phosphate hydrolysis protein n=1 Tax=Thalassococcus halodurans TaxID=373675 RepID=A0A1H5TKA6_9RHOB|nr:5-bromo-4-chloroindolyl phosphate hydrolysis family protein [Thalassococcus halodurans]SEF62447.1 5-bromo-4-chloroindolyl phosphate hydrolysis protein [Thalassococcus halodurans]